MSTQNSMPGWRCTDVRRISALGEPLIELQPGDGGQLQVAFGGDVANGMVCLARILGASNFQLSVVTSLGDSSYSAWLREKLTREGIRVVEPPGTGEPGIYGIPTRPDRQLGFSYWRTQSAARTFLQSAEPHDFEMLLGRTDLLLVTGITLALCSVASFESLYGWVQSHRHECSVVVDCNFRRALWSSDAQARERIGIFEKLASVIATGMEDERSLWQAAGTTDVVERLGGLPAEYLIRGGHEGCWIGVGKQWEHIAALPVAAVDTAGAGDSHLASYVAARVSGCGRSEAARFANSVAALIVGQHGSAPAVGMLFPPLPIGPLR